MANPSAPTWEESEEVKVPTWAESKEIDAPSWEDSEPYVAPVGTLPKSQFGADIQAPVDFVGGAAIEAPFAPTERFVRNPLQATPPENPESLQPLTKASEAKDYLTSPPTPTVAEARLAEQAPPKGSEPFTPQEAEQANAAAIEAFHKPNIQLPKLEIKPDDNRYVAAGKQLVNVATSVPEFFSSPLGYAALVGGGVAPTVVSGLFTVDLLHSLGKQIVDIYGNVEHMTPAQMGEAAVNLVSTGWFAKATGKHTLEGLGKKLPTGIEKQQVGVFREPNERFTPQEPPSSETQGAGKPLETVEPSNTKQPEAPELPKIRKGYRAIKIQLPDGTVIDGITNDKTWEIKGKEVVNVGRPVELNGKIKWSDGPLREGESIQEVNKPAEPPPTPEGTPPPEGMPPVPEDNPPAKPIPPRNPSVVKSEQKPFNLLEEMRRSFGKIRLKKHVGELKPNGAEAEFYASDDYRHLAKNYDRFFDAKGQTIDNAFDWAKNSGHLPQDATFDDFRRALLSAGEELSAYHKGKSKERVTNAFEQHVQKANKRISRHRVQEVPIEQLGLGDKFRLNKIPFEVSHVDATTGEVQLRSDKFGVQSLRMPEGETLKVDNGTLKKNKYKPETDDEGNTLFRKKKNVADQFELPGQEGVFNLAGEKVEGEPNTPPTALKENYGFVPAVKLETGEILFGKPDSINPHQEIEAANKVEGKRIRGWYKEGKFYDTFTEVAREILRLKEEANKQPEQEELFSTQHKDIFKRAFEGDEAAFDILDELLRDAYPDDAALHFGRGDPNTVRTAAAFEKLFEDAFKARDFDKILDAIKATSDVSIWKPLLQKFFKAQKTGDKIAALKADWMRAVFNGTRPDGALPPKAPKPPPKASTTPPKPAQPPPGGGQRPPPRPPPGPPPAPPPRRIDPTGITTGPLKSPYRIIKDFSRSIKHALRVRRQRFGVLGTYHPGSTLTTLRFAGDLDTAAHELAGHWTDDRYGIGRPWMNQRGPSPYDAELAKFWIHGSYRPTMPRRLARAEGIAEYIRAYVVNPDAARLAAPNFTVYFEGSIPAPALKAIKDFSNDVRRWYGANPLEQGRLNFRMNPPGLTEKLWDVLRGEGYGFFITPIDRLRQAFDDSLHYSMKGYRAAKKIQGKNLNPEHDFEIIARLLPSHDARFSDQLEHGLIDYRARQIMRSDGKLEVSRPHDPVTNQPMSLPWLLGNFDRSSSKAFETEMLDTSAYMVHQRALEKAQQLGRTDNITGMAAGMYPGGDVEVANRFFREVANDPAYRAKLAENARRYRLWADHNLQMLLDAGRITPAQFNRIKANNTQYVTMNRLSEEFDIKHGGKSSRAVGTAKQPIEHFKGSALEINNVYSNLLEQTDAVQKEAFRNGAMQAYVESLVHNRRLNEPDRKNLQEFGHISNSTEPHTIKVYRNGKTEYWKFDKHIYENLKGLTELGIQVPWLLRSIPMFSRYMITHAPSFLLRNPVRDTFQRAVVSNNGSKPWDILRGYSQADLSRMNIFGGGQFGNYIIDKHVWNRELNRVARELVKDPRNILFSPLKLKHAWEELAKKSESVGRIGEFRRAFDAAKARGMDDYNAALYASAEARGLLDFAKAGTAMRVINQLIPFSNARIRGLARSAFQIKEHPGRFALNWGTMVLAPVLLTMLWNRKDKETWEEYQQLPAYRKDFFWNFKIGNHWIIIPRPHELGVMAGGVERAINRMLGDKRALEGYGQSIGSAYLPVQDPVEATGPLRTGLELYFNRDSFRGHDIVPGWEKDLNLNLREGTKHASTIGQNLGKILQSTGIGADPRQVDYFLNSLGGFGQMATTVTSPTRTMGEFAAKSTGYSTDVPSSGARDVQWDLNFAKENGLTQRDEIKKLKLLREDVLNEKDPAIRDRKAKVLRDYATALRTGLEKMGPLKQKLPAKVR